MNEEVTRHDVERLWADAIAGLEVAPEAQALIDRVNAETPIVNWGLHAMHDLRLPDAASDPVSLVESRARWRAQLAEYDADPAAWMRGYFRRMVAQFAETHGAAAARSFGRKLVENGRLADADVRRALEG